MLCEGAKLFQWAYFEKVCSLKEGHQDLSHDSEMERSDDAPLIHRGSESGEPVGPLNASHQQVWQRQLESLENGNCDHER